MTKKVTVCIVTWNSSKYIERCLECLNNQSFEDYELIIVDNNSNDQTTNLVKKNSPNAKIIENQENLGFCGGHNLGIQISESEYYMPYNPDIFANKDYLKEMVKAIETSSDIGAVSGKLLRFDPRNLVPTNIIDSTGVYFKKNRRSLDRGAEEKDLGQYEEKEYVFGSSGAAPLYNRKMLEDISIENEYFLSYFFAYREDVDLAWRAQQRDWKCIYTPKAVAYHVRTNTPLKRNDMSKKVNMHSVKNRLIMLIQNESFLGLKRDGFYFVGYELLIFIYILFKERSSIPAYIFIYKNFKKVKSVRKQIFRERKVTSEEIIKWFGRVDREKIG